MSIRVLIIDDEKNIRNTLEQCLVSEGFDVTLAETGEEGLNSLAEAAYDVTLLDIRMPGLSGMETLERIRSAGYTTSVIMMTAYGTVENAVEAMKLGALDFISKPFSPEDIRRAVRQVLNRNNLEEAALAHYTDYLEYAKSCILKRDFQKAESYLKKAAMVNINDPEPQNLFGVIAEFKGDYVAAGKHYRAACALDPTYKPADRNLQRLTNFNYTLHGISMGEDH